MTADTHWLQPGKDTDPLVLVCVDLTINPKVDCRLSGGHGNGVVPLQVDRSASEDCLNGTVDRLYDNVREMALELSLQSIDLQLAPVISSENMAKCIVRSQPVWIDDGDLPNASARELDSEMAAHGATTHEEYALVERTV